MSKRIYSLLLIVKHLITQKARNPSYEEAFANKIKSMQKQQIFCFLKMKKLSITDFLILLFIADCFFGLLKSFNFCLISIGMKFSSQQKFIFCALLIFIFNSYTVNAQSTASATPRANISTEKQTKVDKIESGETPFPIPRIRFEVDPSKERGQLTTSLQIVILLTILSLAPSILIMLTSFTRILIVLNFVRRALTTQTEPSNQIMIGLALFITFYTMTPVTDKIYKDAYLPYSKREINEYEAFSRTLKPIREFMFSHARKADLGLFASLEGGAKPKTREEYSTIALIPAFLTSEIRTGFQMGVIIFLPFLLIDLVIASILMSMGMMMLPPAMISLPFKILLFVMVDGWNLIIRSLVQSFGGGA
ncbi:MAG: flagellar type III secretion system pore protein FliP [Candidatus Riflebacteria bacterium]|nr:flagellar type III secretion system pore protein FliP [Candidatus Riflebacteria bacterium]